jgi:hypothetical protein
LIFPSGRRTGRRGRTWSAREGALTIIPWIVLGSVIAVVFAIRGPLLHPFFGVFECLFYLSSITWMRTTAIEGGP